MQSIKALLGVVAVTFTAYAEAPADAKKAGPLLAEQGVTSYTLDSVFADAAGAGGDSETIRLTLRRNDAIVAYVTVNTLSATDQIVTYEPVAGETLVVESLMSKGEVTLRTPGGESHTSQLDRSSGRAAWRKSGSEALFSRTQKAARVVAALIADLQERGVIAVKPAPVSAGR